MELRKMQLIGRGSFSITLPPDWVKENKLKPSDQITITREDDGSLRLVPGIIREEKKEVKITIDADRLKYPRLLNRLIIGGYIRGCDSIEVVSKKTISENHRKEIHDAIDSLMGLGVVESSSNHIVLQSMVDHSKFPIMPLLRRLEALVSSMYEDALKALKERDLSLASNVVQRENEVDKIYWLMGRQTAAAALDKTVLKKIDLKGTSDLALHIVIFPRIRAIAEYAVDIANNQLSLKEKMVGDADLQKVIRLGKMVQVLCQNSCKGFFDGDIILANNTLETFEQIEKMNDELRMDMGPRIKDPILAMHLMTIIRDMDRIARYGKFIAEVTIHSAARKNNLP